MIRTFRHSGDIGDIIYSLPIVRRLGGGMYYLESVPSVTRPMTPEKFNALKPLLEAQPYIEGCQWRIGQDIDIDFVPFRKAYSRVLTLTQSQARFLKLRGVDQDTAWLTAPNPGTHGRPVIARSARYQNHVWSTVIWPEILDIHKDPLFVGTKDEHAQFCKKFRRKVEYAETPTFADLANLIAGSSIFIGNQSSPNAVAEGLKHKSIQETHPTIHDAKFSRPNGQYIWKLKQWRDEVPCNTRPPFALAIQVWDGDVHIAKDLAKLIVSIEKIPRPDIEFIVWYRRDTNKFAVEDLVRIIKPKFPLVRAWRSGSFGKGWPSGPNGMWQDLMDTLLRKIREGTIKSKAVLTFEPDCIPLRPDWIDALHSAWRHSGCALIGHSCNDPKTHINGNMVIRTDAMDEWPRLRESSPTSGWDVFNGTLLLSIGDDTPMISQQYRIHETDRAFVEGIRKKGKIPAMFHGLKKGCGIPHVRAMMEDGAFWSRK